MWGRQTCSVGIKITNRSALQPGDLVFFSKVAESRHAGIYIGGGQFIHTSSSKRKVAISIDSAYRKKHFR